MSDDSTSRGPGSVSERLLPTDRRDRRAEGSTATGAVGLGLGIGLALGAMFGLVMNQLAIGLVLGIGIGIALGMAFSVAVDSE